MSHIVGLFLRQRNPLRHIRRADLDRHVIARPLGSAHTGRLSRLDFFQSENVQQLNIQRRQLVCRQYLGRPRAAGGLDNGVVIQATLGCCSRACGVTIDWY